MHQYLLLIIIITALLPTSNALNCDKEFNYYENYGVNGFDVTCNGIKKGYEKMLEDIAIYNEITLTITNSSLQNVTSNIFRNVKNIRNLVIVNSTFTFQPRHSVFEKFHKLEHLEIDNTGINISNTTMNGLEKLKELVLNNNSISVIETGSFQSLKELDVLKITNNKVKQLSDVPICELKKLKTVNLAHNLITSLKYYYFLCKKRKKSLDFSLNNSDLQLDIATGTFYNVTDVTFELVDINLSNNQILDLGLSLEGLTKLRYLNLEGNKLKNIHRLLFKTLSSLETVNLRQNNIESLDNVLNHKKRLKSVELGFNNLKSFNLENVFALDYINLENNRLNSISFKDVPSLKRLILRNNSITTLNDEFFSKVPSLIELNLASNYLHVYDNFFQKVPNLQQLILNRNNLTVLPELLFSNLTKLKGLDLSQNSIESFHERIFINLGELEVLNISYNKLQQLNYSLVQPLTNLNVLDLAGNYLHYIEYDLIISKLPALSVINIKANLLSCEVLKKIISYLTKKNIKYTANSDHVDYEKENVAGIYCDSDKASAVLVNNNASGLVVNHPATAASSERYVLFDFGITLIIILTAVLIGILLFRIHVYLKRRRYRADEFELVDE